MRVRAYEPKPPGEERSIHVTSLLSDPKECRVFLGLTDMKNDLLYTFHPKTSSFESCRFKRIADKYDVKIHRSLIFDEDGSIIGATAGLHGVQERENAKGGKIFRYSPSDGSLELLGEPVKRDYIQSILYDPERRVVYGFTYPVAHFFRFHVDTGQTRSFYIDSYPHLPALDDDGCVWGTWGQGNNLLKYDPESDEINWYNTRIPRISVSHLSSAPGDPGQVDCMLNGRDGFIYMGSVSGGLFRLDPVEVAVDYLGKPLLGLRMAALTLGEGGLIYGIGGMKDGTHLFSYDREAGRFDVIGRICDSESGECPYITHHVVMVDSKTFYSGETDNPERSGYLWETKLG